MGISNTSRSVWAERFAILAGLFAWVLLMSGPAEAKGPPAGRKNTEEHTRYGLEMQVIYPDFEAVGLISPGVGFDTYCTLDGEPFTDEVWDNNGEVVTEKENVSETLTILRGAGPDLMLNLIETGITWTRQYPASASGDFNYGCFGATQYDNGHLEIIIDHPRRKGKEKNKGHFIRFEWTFGFYVDEIAGVVEHFTLTSEWIELHRLDYSGGQPILVPAQWDPDKSVIRVIAGNFDIDYYLEVNGVPVPGKDHVSLTPNGEGVYMELWMHTDPFNH